MAFSLVLRGIVVGVEGNVLISSSDEEGYMEFIQLNENVFKIEFEHAASYADENGTAFI